MIVEVERHGVVVAGGGAIGCAVAHAVARTGRAVTVVDPGRIEEAATWAAGGMLSPLGEAPEPGPFLRLALRSRELWPAFAADIESATGADLGLRFDGKLLVAMDEAEVTALERRCRWQEAAGFDVRRMDGPEVRRLEPAVADSARAGLLLATDGAVDNRRLGRALRRAVRRAGGRILEGRRVAALSARGGRVEGVHLDDGTALPAATVVVAAGAWSGAIDGLPRSLPVRPVRGQMLAYRLEAPLVDRVVAGDVYLIPRREGRGHHLLVGATQEEAGFDRSTTPSALERLRAGARALVPAMGEAAEAETWAGLRPGTPDDLPVLGPDPELEGLVWATGHFRNGILLAPVTAEIVAAVLEGEEPVPLEGFRADRFR